MCYMFSWDRNPYTLQSTAFGTCVALYTDMTEQVCLDGSRMNYVQCACRIKCLWVVRFELSQDSLRNTGPKIHCENGLCTTVYLREETLSLGHCGLGYKIEYRGTRWVTDDISSYTGDTGKNYRIATLGECSLNLSN